ncbi:MAG TPA: 5-formyltetrahydrofolate cyclo-ligase [bacterium]|nr:5-formyltetrahydrofolate cyclo-ligase [bacterium]
MGDLRAEKMQLRASMRALRDALSAEERARLSDRIAARLGALLDRLAPRTVMVFSSFGSEVSTRSIIETLLQAGRRVALPVVAGHEMRAASFRPGDPVRTARYGAAEPTAAAEVPPDAIDVVIVPGLAFDRRGYRVGYGRGYYDRFLVRTRPDTSRIGIAFHAQVVDAVPRGDADQPVDAIVTELEVVCCRPPRRPE